MSAHEHIAGHGGSRMNGPAGLSPSAAPVSLTAIIERRVPLAWPEALALITEACRMVVESDPDASAVPDPWRLFVFPDGHMEIERGRGDMDLVGTARTLHALMASSQPPTPLRLFVGHAISSEKFTKVAEFGAALGYYERPGRAELIQAAYERFQATPPDLPAPKEQPLVAPEAVSTEPKKKPPMRVGRLLVAAVFLIVFFGGVSMALRIVSRQQNAELASQGERVTTVAAASSEFAKLRNALRGLGLPIGVEEAKVEPTAPATPAESTTVRRPARVRPQETALASLVPSDGRGPVAPGPSVGDVAGTPVVVASAADETPIAPEPPDENIYTNESPGVTPPVAIDKRVMPPTLQVTETRALNRMELIIGTDGLVEQVRMISELERLPDMMMLSGAKSWRFRPATKDGRPVRYRLPLTWTVSPR